MARKIPFVSHVSIIPGNVVARNGDRLRFLDYFGNLRCSHFAATFVSRKRFRRTMSELIKKEAKLGRVETKRAIAATATLFHDDNRRDFRVAIC